MPRTTTRIIIGFILFALAVGAGVPAAQLALFALSPAQRDSSETLAIEIRRGQGPQEVSKTLAARGVVSDAAKLVWLGRIARKWGHIKAGEYSVSPAMTPFEVLSIITSGVSLIHPLTIREGQNMYEIAAAFEQKQLAAKSRMLMVFQDPGLIATLGFRGKQPANLEGYLFPDTYHFNRTLSPEEMARQMVKRFFSVWGEAEEAQAAKIGLNRHEAITLASIIEKETGAAHERPLISAVFHNRLRKRMRLQSDPTTIYGMWDRYQGKIGKADLLAENPYNTYFISALPVGPIANPGRESILAALSPANADFLFFVSQNDGTHEFSRSLEEHNRAVRKFQLDPKARNGKSWRDLNAKSAPATR
jgi:UPF0755 protein